MKVKALLLCLALVPLVIAQNAEPAVPEESDTIFDNLWSMVSNFLSGNRDRLTDRMQKGIDLVNQGLTTLAEAADEYSIDVEIPPQRFPDAAEIIANITQKVQDLKTKTEQRVEEIKQMTANFDIYDVIDNEPEVEPEVEPTPAHETHEAQAEDNWWPW